MSIPFDFDWKEYLSLNCDLTYNNEEEAKYHYLNYGIRENRKYKDELNNFTQKKMYNGIPYDFVWKEYLLLNPDLPFKNEGDCINHYLNHGINECRSYKRVENPELPEDFNWKEYILANDDIKHLTEQIAAENHYINHGKRENRNYNFKPSNINIFEHSNGNISSSQQIVKKKSRTIEKINNMKYDMHYYVFKHYGILLNDDLGSSLLNKYKHIINKYNVNDPKWCYILYYVLNINYKIDPNKNGFELCISLYNETNIMRICELLLVLCKNIQNKNIKRIHILYEKYYETNSLVKEIVDTLILDRKLGQFIKITNIDERPSFQSIFDYVDNFDDKFIVSNSDIIFDNSLDNLRNIKKNEFICLSRKNWNLFNNTWEMITFNLGPNDPKKYLNYFSHDVWVFHAPLTYKIKIDISLGEMFCDSYLDYKLSKTNYDCFNLSNDVNCLHVQNGFSASQEVSTNPDVYHKALAKLQAKDPGVSETIYALDATNIHDYNTSRNIHKNKFYTHSEYLAKIRSDWNYQK
jgi:hypothetical protein